MDVPTPCTPFESIASLPALQAGWARVLANAGAAGGDGVTVRAFAATADERLAELAADLQAGRYRAGPVRKVTIPKRSGGERVLSIPCVADRVVQAAAVRVLSPRIEPHLSPASFGYRPGLSADAATKHIERLQRSGYRWTAESDIRQFFDSALHRHVLRSLENHARDPRLSELVFGWLDGQAKEQGLPQGNPISPLLSNLLLDAFDRSITGSGIRLVRFADDFVLLCRSESHARMALDRSISALARLGLAVNDEKTFVHPPGCAFEFLGRRFASSICVGHPKDARPCPPPDKDRFAPPADQEVAIGEAHRPVFRVAYVTRPYRRLAVSGKAFAVFDGDREIAVLPSAQVDRIEVGSSCKISSAALRLALNTGTVVAFVDAYGRTLGTCQQGSSSHAALHLAQARCVIDPKQRLDLARRIVAGRIRNQRALLRRLKRQQDTTAIDEAATALRRIERRLPPATETSEIMGYEGRAAAIYWPVWASLLRRGWSFGGRTRHPPRDAANAVLSWCASMLHRDLSVLAVRHGLHPGFGALHESRDGHEGTVSDLIEEFRAPLVEGLALYLANNRILAPDMFFTADDGSVRSSRVARERIIRNYEGWLDRTITSPRTGRRILWRRLLEEQVVAYAQHCRGETPYEPYAMDF